MTDPFPVLKSEGTSLQQLTGHGGIGSGIFSGNIYNGTQDWTITEVTILLIPKGKEKNAVAFLDAKEYNEYVVVPPLPPLTNRSFSFYVDGPKQNYSWNVVRARGHRSR